MKIVIIGGQNGGLSLAKNLRKENSTDEIIIVEKLAYMSYVQQAMPYYISGELTEEQLMKDEVRTLKEVYNIDVKLTSEVIDIIPNDNEIKVIDTKTSNMFKITYDKLILSVGTLSKKLDEFNNVSENIFIHKNLSNAKRLKKYLDKNHPQTAAIIGTGKIVLELAENLNKRGIYVNLIQEDEEILKELDSDISKEVQEIFQEYIQIYPNSKITKVSKVGQIDTKIKIEFNSDIRNVLKVDFVIVCAGYIPATKFIKRAGIVTDEHDYIIVNEYMQTNISNIYAIGDVTRIKTNLGINTYSSNASQAEKHAKIVAYHILNKPIKYKGTIKTTLVEAFGYQIAQTGHTETELQKANIQYYTKIIMGDNGFKEFKQSKKMLLKGIFEKGTKKLLGATCIAEKGADKKIDVLSTAIQAEFTALDLIMLELSFIPKLNTVPDIINILGERGQEDEKN